MSSVTKYLKLSRNSFPSCYFLHDKKKDHDNILLFLFWLAARNLIISTGSLNQHNTEEVQPSFWKDSFIVAALLGTLNWLVFLTLCVCRNK